MTDYIDWDGVKVSLANDPGPTFNATFQGIYDEAFALLIDRQKKYGPENVATQGFYGIFTRLSRDKIERLRRSLNGRIYHGVLELDAFEDAEDESIEDTLIDIANYALIMLALKRGVWGRPLESELKGR